MKKNLKLFSLSLLLSCVLTACNGTSIIKSPNENGGLIGNQDQDTVSPHTTTDLTTLLTKVSKIKKYSYQVTSNIIGNESSFTDYFTPNAWYEENEDPTLSFGYAQTMIEKYMFKYYLSEDGKECYPSIYEYGGVDTLEKVQGLYGVFTLTSFELLQDCLDDLTATYISANKYLITSTDAASVFQYMTTFGSSIATSLQGVYIGIINLPTSEFKATVDLGQYGTIVCHYNALETTKIDFVSNLASNGEITGVDYYDDVKELLSVKMKNNNYVLEGIKTIKDGIETAFPYKIYCTNNYFYLTYNDPYHADYRNYGYILVPKGKEITYINTDEEGNKSTITQTLTYDSCYGFTEDDNGELYFDFFKGPIETDSIKYIEVVALPTVGEPNILYIVPNDEGGKDVYEWVADSNGNYAYSYYQSWYDTVGDFYINNASATFYLSGTPLASIGPNYFEKTLGQENSYFSYDNAILSTLANGLFGWGFQASTTWMDYITKANLRIHKDEAGEIIGGDIGLEILASLDGDSVSNNEIFYTISQIDNAFNPQADAFYQSVIGE